MGSASIANLDLSAPALFGEKQLMILFSDPSEKNDYLKQVKFRLEKKSHLYLFESTKSSSILSEVNRFQGGAFFFSIRTENELELLARVLGDFRSKLKTVGLHAIGTCDLENPKSFEILRLLGAEVYPFSLEWTDLEKKIDTFCLNLASKCPDSVQSNLPVAPELKIWISRKGGPPIEALPIEFNGDQLLLDAGSDLFTLGEEVLLSTNDGSPGLSTKISQILSTEDGRSAIVLGMSAKLEAQFISVRTAREKAQGLILDFMKSAKGY